MNKPKLIPHALIVDDEVTSRRHKLPKPILPATLSLFAAVLLTGCGHKSETRSPAPRPELPTASVRVQTIATTPEASTEEVLGTIRAKLRATLEAKVSGSIEEMPIVLGQQVKAGELLARLDAAEIQARVQQAEATLQQAERDWKRAATLFEQQALTRSEYEAAEAHQRVAQAGVAEARAMLTYIEVRAPFSGLVTRKWADRGDLAAPGKSLVTLEDPTVLQLEADIPETIAAKIERGAKMQVRIDTSQQALSGVVSEISPMADPDTRTLHVKLDLPQSKDFISGQFARLFVPTGQSNCLRVPGSAVVRRGQLEIVFVATTNRAEMHLVKTGRQLGSDVEVLSGLDPGDAVVIEGAAQLFDGQPLAVR